MKNRVVTLVVAMLLGAAQIAAAQAPAPAQTPAAGGRGGRGQAQNQLVSPEVHPDRRVTFRIRAPQASTVTLTGSWLATLASPNGGTLPMTKDAEGVWSVTSEPLEPNVQLYFFNVDGMAIADPINPRIKLRTRTSASLVDVPGTPAPPWQLRDVPHGSVDWNVHRSAVYNDDHEFFVYLPPGYFQSNTRYPVLYLVHGAGDPAAAWVNVGATNVILDNLIADKKAVPMIVVMPFNGSNNPAPQAGGGRGGGAPGAVSPFENYMLKELIPAVEKKYRVAPGRQNRGMAGVSAGGQATFNVGLKHLDLFSNFGMFSAGGRGGADIAERYPALVADAKTANARINLLWIGCGLVDPYIENAKAFDAELTRLGIKHVYTSREGGHVWPVWRWTLAEFVPLLFQVKR